MVLRAVVPGSAANLGVSAPSSAAMSSTATTCRGFVVHASIDLGPAMDAAVTEGVFVMTLPLETSM